MQARIDKYTRPLLESPARLAFAIYLAGALKGKDHAERVAVGQDLAEHVGVGRGSRHEFVQALAAVDERREQHARERAAGIAVGDGCGQPMTCAIGPNTQPQCFVDGRRLCDYDRVGSRTASTAGNAIFSLQPEPGAGSVFWRPKGVRASAVRASDPSIPAWEGLFVTGITVGTAPVEGFNNAPTATITDGIFLGDYVVPDGTAIPVGWPPFSTLAMKQQLQIFGIGLWPAASAYFAGVTVLGNRYDPATASESRCHPQASSVPPVAGNNTYTSTGAGSYPA